MSSRGRSPRNPARVQSNPERGCTSAVTAVRAEAMRTTPLGSYRVGPRLPGATPPAIHVIPLRGTNQSPPAGISRRWHGSVGACTVRSAPSWMFLGIPSLAVTLAGRQALSSALGAARCPSVPDALTHRSRLAQRDSRAPLAPNAKRKHHRLESRCPNLEWLSPRTATRELSSLAHRVRKDDYAGDYPDPRSPHPCEPSG